MKVNRNCATVSKSNNNLIFKTPYIQYIINILIVKTMKERFGLHVCKINGLVTSYLKPKLYSK